MPLIKSFKGSSPQLHDSVYVAETAVLIGKIEMGEDSSVWFNTVLRGDVDWIRIGKRTNVQDGVVMHCSTGVGPTIIGDEVTIGHRAIVHGATVGNNCLIGMNATVLDRAVLQDNVVVAAGAVVLEGAQLESGWLYGGIPAKKIKQLSPQQIQLVKWSAIHYVEESREYLAEEE